MSSYRRKDMITYSGIAASHGIAIGPTLLFHKEPITVDRCPITDAASELSRLPAAVEEAKQQLGELFEKPARKWCEKEQNFSSSYQHVRKSLADWDDEILVTEQHINLSSRMGCSGALCSTAFSIGRRVFSSASC
jgi:phosphoenolpyruvate-protein kinase (PTS system EI component)